MENIICVDLTAFNNEKLKILCEMNDLDCDFFLLNKKNGVAKIYIEKSTYSMIAFTTKKNKGVMTYTEELSKILSNLPSLIIVKKTNVMTINFILDKINKYGLNSLTIEEKVFLENQSK